MKSTQVIPVYIKPKLIPFLYKQFNGVEAKYLHHNVKAIDIKTNTPLGCFIRLQMEKLDYPVKDIDGFNMFLKIRGWQSKNFGKLYNYTNSQNHFLHLPKLAVDKINDYLDCIFYNSLYNFLDAWSYTNESLTEGVLVFLEKNNLLDQDFNIESIRRQFYRWKEKENKLQKFTKTNSLYVTG